MSALRKKILEKKKALDESSGSSPAPAPAPASHIVQRSQAKVEDGGIKKGWLSSGSLYPEGSTEATPHLWRSREIVERNGKIFDVTTLDTAYEVRGTFKEAGRFLGKEDFAVTRTGFSLRICGSPDADEQSLVKGLDETVTLPADADFEQVSAEYLDCTLCIKVARSTRLQELLKQLSPEEAQALSQKYGVIAPEIPDHAPGSASDEASADSMLTPQFWSAFGQVLGLSIREEVEKHASSGGSADAPAVQAGVSDELRESMREAGFAELRARGAGEVSSYATAIDELDSRGLPPAFLMAFDEPWTAVGKLAAEIGPALGLSLQYGTTVVNVKPKAAGCKMQRGRSGSDTKRAFRETDGLPQGAAVVLALTDTAPSSSCFYALPASADPHYRCAPDSTAQDDGDIAGITSASHQHIRALPIAQGMALVLSHRVIHWQSAHVGKDAPCRAIVFDLADSSFEAPLLASPGACPPAFGARLALIALSLFGGHEQVPVPRPLLPLLLSILVKYATHLSDAALECGRRIGTTFQRNLVSVHDELIDLHKSFAAVGSTAVAEEASRQALEQALVCGVIANFVITTRGLAAATSLQRVASHPTERALESSASEPQGPVAESASRQPAPGLGKPIQDPLPQSMPPQPAQPVKAPSRFEEVD